MPALICGSLAFDTIANFHGRFAEQILPDHIHILNTSFLVPTLLPPPPRPDSSER